MFYDFARAVCRIVLFILRRWKVTGLENFPAEGGVIAAANHTSYWDPVIIGCAINRRIHFMAKAELFDIPLLGLLIRKLHAFPVHRDKSDRRALRQATEVLKAGNVLGVFPEGTRSSTGELLKPHLGTALIAFKAGVPIVPIALIGARGFCGKVTVQIGKPVPLPKVTDNKPQRQDLENYINQVMLEISRLIGDKSA